MIFVTAMQHGFPTTDVTPAELMAKLAALPRAKLETCVALLDREPNDVALARGEPVKTILQRRRRVEMQLGIRLPRFTRRGRPTKRAAGRA